MSHYSQEKFVEVTTNYLKKNIRNFNKLSVLDIGSINLNGSSKKFFGNDYFGIDLINGPNVDMVLDGQNLHKLKKKFDIIISCEVFEHASNWKKIFQAMFDNLKSSGIIIFSCASTGRLEHGTNRTNPAEGGLPTNYYKNLTSKDFKKNFDLNRMFKKFYFFYNFYSHDLYFVGFKEKNYFYKDDNMYQKDVKKIKSDTNIIFYKRLLYSHLMSDKLYQNFRFLRRKIMNFRFLRQKIMNFILLKK